MELSKARRIDYLWSEIKRLRKKHAASYRQEILEVCITALQDRIEQIVRGEV